MCLLPSQFIRFHNFLSLMRKQLLQNKAHKIIRQCQIQKIKLEGVFQTNCQQKNLVIIQKLILFACKLLQISVLQSLQVVNNEKSTTLEINTSTESNQVAKFNSIQYPQAFQIFHIFSNLNQMIMQMINLNAQQILIADQQNATANPTNAISRLSILGNLPKKMSLKGKIYIYATFYQFRIFNYPEIYMEPQSKISTVPLEIQFYITRYIKRVGWQ